MAIEQQQPQNGDSGTTTDITLRFDTDYTHAQRFPIWMSLFVFSTVCVAALQTRRHIFDADSAGEAWVLSVSVISMVLSLGAVVAYLLFRAVFVGQLPEVAVISLLIAFWAAGLPTLMNPDNDIAVSKPSNGEIAPTVTNANLYFFAWLSFASTVYLSGSLAQEFTGVNVRSMAPAKTARWYGLTAASLVVMGSAVRTFRVSQCGEEIDASEYCKRTKFAVSLGVIGFFLAGGMTYLTQQGLTIVAETGITTFQLILWCFGVGYTTFGTSPGSTIGNLFFSTWVSFILTVFIFAQCFREYVAGREEGIAAQSGNGTTPDNDEAPQYDDTI